MPGTFIISLDVESAWGTFDLGGLKTYKKHFDSWRESVDTLIGFLEEYQIKATWGFVGHLFLDQCEKVNGVQHPDVLAPQYSEPHRNWRSFDPATNSRADPYWYGKDVLAKVKAMSLQQEIGTHTFSHVIMLDEECTKEVVRSELQKCRELAQKEDVEISSMIFPRNKVAHLDVVREAGIVSYRGPQKHIPGLPQIVSAFVEKAFIRTPFVYKIEELVRHEGVLEIPSSMVLTSYDGIIRNIIPASFRVRQAKKGMEQAIEKQAIFHLWFHPFNLGSAQKMVSNVRDILGLARTYIDQGKLQNLTMRETEQWYREYEKH